jgi:putative phosphonate metabolism protein
MSSPRYAIYFTPPPDSPLAVFGASVIGYDCFRRADVPHRLVDGIDPSVLALATVDPRRYGFHATLVAPFHMSSDTEASLIAAFSAFAARHAPVALGPLQIATMGRFLVLAPLEPCPQLEELAAACVTDFDRHRAALSDADRARRIAAGLTQRQTELLDRWGYPYVLDEYRFHMTLAGPVPDDELPAFKSRLSEAFDGLARDHLELGAISLMRQDDRASRFYVLERQRLTGRR